MFGGKLLEPSIFFYGGLCRRVLGQRRLICLFVISSALHGLGHGVMAVAAGLLGRALATHQPALLESFAGSFSASPIALSLVGLGAAVVKGVGWTWGATVQSRLAQNVASGVRLTMSESLLRGGASLPSSGLSARFAVRLSDVERSVQDGVLGGARALLEVLPLAAGLALLSPRLALGAILLLVPFGFVSAWVRQRWACAHNRAHQIAESVHQQVDELVRNVDVWRTYGAGSLILDRLGRLSVEAARASSRVEGGRAALSSSNEVLAALALVAAVWASQSARLSEPPGTLLAFAAVFFMMYRPMRDLGDARTALVRGSVALAALRDAIRTAPVVRDAMTSGLIGAKSIPSRTATLRPAADASIWPCATLVANRLGVARAQDGARVTSFSIGPGEIVVLVGPTGSGKTTLLRVLLGLEPDPLGAVFYAGEDITHAPVGPGARPFAWAPQDGAVLSGSLDENLAIARPEAPPRLSELLGALGAERLAVDTKGELLGAAGRPVSGGERKWIALARALASEQPVLLLDEPTAGLDRDARARVLETIAGLRGKRSVLLVTHELEPLEIADRIISIGSTGSGGSTGAAISTPPGRRIPPPVSETLLGV